MDVSLYTIHLGTPWRELVLNIGIQAHEVQCTVLCACNSIDERQTDNRKRTNCQSTMGKQEMQLRVIKSDLPI